MSNVNMKDVDSENDLNSSQAEDNSSVDGDEWELVEEEDIVVDLVGVMNNEYIRTCDSDKVKLIELLTSDNPILQLDQFVFLGRKEEAPGTCVLFRVNEYGEESSTDDDEHHEVESESKRRIEFLSLSRKKLVMEQASMKAKK